MRRIDLKGVQNSTDTTSQNMKETLTSIKRSAAFMSQSSATMTAIMVGFLALTLIASVVCTDKLMLPMLIASFILLIILGTVWDFLAWLDTKE